MTVDDPKGGRGVALVLRDCNQSPEKTFLTGNTARPVYVNGAPGSFNDNPPPEAGSLRTKSRIEIRGPSPRLLPGSAPPSPLIAFMLDASIDDAAAFVRAAQASDAF